MLCCVFTHTGCGVHFDRESVTPDKLQRMMDTGMLRLLSNCHYSNTEKLGEVLIKTMLDEVSEFCKIDVQHNWTLQSRQQVHIVLSLFTLYIICILYTQLIYEVTEGSGTIQLITLKRESLNQDEAMKFKVLGIELPSMMYATTICTVAMSLFEYMSIYRVSANFIHCICILMSLVYLDNF